MPRSRTLVIRRNKHVVTPLLWIHITVYTNYRYCIYMICTWIWSTACNFSWRFCSLFKTKIVNWQMLLIACSCDKTFFDNKRHTGWIDYKQKHSSQIKVINLNPQKPFRNFSLMSIISFRSDISDAENNAIPVKYTYCAESCQPGGLQVACSRPWKIQALLLTSKHQWQPCWKHDFVTNVMRLWQPLAWDTSHITPGFASCCTRTDSQWCDASITRVARFSSYIVKIRQERYRMSHAFPLEPWTPLHTDCVSQKKNHQV